MGIGGKILSDSQHLRVPPPPNPEAAAVIDALSVSEDSTAVAGEGNVLSGTVSRLNLERKTGQLFATILIGDLTLTVALPPQQENGHDIFPGKPIFVSYRPDQIKWF